MQRAVLYVVSPLQTVVWSSATGEPRRPPPGLAEVSQVEATSNTVMAQMSGMMATFQAQISDLSAKVNFGSSMLTPLARSLVAEATLVKPDAVRPMTSSAPVAMVRSLDRLAHSSVEASASTVRC